MRVPRNIRRVAILAIPLVVAILVAMPTVLPGQVVTRAPFVVAQGARQVDVAATHAGIFVVRQSLGTTLSVQRITPTTPWPAAAGVDGGAIAIDPAIAVDPTDGFTVAWRNDFDLRGRFLDARGVASSAIFQQTLGLGIGPPRLAGVTLGMALLWSEIRPQEERTLWMQIGSHRHALGLRPIEADVAATPDGGCVVVWHADGTEARIYTQRFDAGSAAVGPAVPLAIDALAVYGVATDPTTGAAGLVGLRPTGTPFEHAILVVRFDASGALLGPEIVVDTTRSHPNGLEQAVTPSLDFDFGGNLYVAWGDYAPATAGVRVRAFEPDGTPFGPTMTVAPEVPRVAVRTAILPDGQFVNAWVTGATAYATVVSLCAPGSAVCGDGVLVPACERCDAGAANADGVADACRTSCLPAHCGDGVVDTGEQCDDGNFEVCDGCSPRCVAEGPIVCGDGITARACGEQCDDGNGLALDGCTPACRLERIPGGGTPKTDCLTTWSIDDPTTTPPYDKQGAISGKHRCVDDDPRCDFDGGVPGACTFRVRACGNNTGVAGCAVPERLSSWTIHRPSANQAAKLPWMSALRATLLASVPGALLGPSDRDVCSAWQPVGVPLRGVPGAFKAGRIKIQSRAESYDGRRDQDTLGLECVPAGS